MSSFFSHWWNYFLPLPKPQTSLGQELKRAREFQGLSISTVASALHLPETVVVALEEGIAPPKKGSEVVLLAPGYDRLTFVQYARFLGMNLQELQPLLPPMAPLHYSDRTMIKNLSYHQARARKPHFIKQQPFSCSLSAWMSTFKKLGLRLLGLILLFYIWSILRHLGRVL